MSIIVTTSRQGYTLVTPSSRSTSKKTAQSIAKLANDKKAENIVVLDMRKLVNFCDYFVICSGTSARQLHAAADGIEAGLALEGIRVRRRQGAQDATWVLLDMGDVVVHLFEGEAREFYGLEHLWQDAPKVKWQT